MGLTACNEGGCVVSKMSKNNEVSSWSYVCRVVVNMAEQLPSVAFAGDALTCISSSCSRVLDRGGIVKHRLVLPSSRCQRLFQVEYNDESRNRLRASAEFGEASVAARLGQQRLKSDPLHSSYHGYSRYPVFISLIHTLATSKRSSISHARRAMGSACPWPARIVHSSHRHHPDLADPLNSQQVPERPRVRRRLDRNDRR